MAATQAAAGEVDAAEASLRRSPDILAPLGARYLDQGPLQIPLAKVRQQLGDLLRQSALNSSNNPETKAATLLAMNRPADAEQARQLRRQLGR